MSATRYLNKSFNAELSLTFSKIEKLGNINLDSSVSLFAIDLNGNYKLNALFGSTGFFEPYVLLGAGYTSQKSTNAGYPFNSTVSLNSGLGAKFWISDNFGVRIQSSLKYFFNNDSYRHFQHSASLIYKIGGDVDSDKDGINDKNDACPEVFGLAEFNGCPDTDGDGIEDAKDSCPEVAGLAEYNGCPDTDGDGISDDKDKCPNVAGLAALAGCPDADGDGVTDGDDNCVNEAGPAANNGCPWPDADGDGVLDKDDQCPNEAGVVANNGCPEVVLPTPEVQAQLTSYARTINFNTGKSTFKEEAYPTLQAITAILKEYPKANFMIEGHTDSVGSNSLNQKLADARANAVMDYLINNGVSAARLNAKGYGEESPIESNNTRAGRAANRRVEVKLVN